MNSNVIDTSYLYTIKNNAYNHSPSLREITEQILLIKLPAIHDSIEDTQMALLAAINLIENQHTTNTAIERVLSPEKKLRLESKLKSFLEKKSNNNNHKTEYLFEEINNNNNNIPEIFKNSIKNENKNENSVKKIEKIDNFVFEKFLSPEKLIQTDKQTNVNSNNKVKAIKSVNEIVKSFENINRNIKNETKNDTKNVIKTIIKQTNETKKQSKDTQNTQTIEKLSEESINDNENEENRSLLIHRIPKELTINELKLLIINKTNIIPLMISNINNAKCKIIYQTTKHCNLVFGLFEGLIFFDKTNKPQKRIYLSNGGYICIRKFE